jgi:probable rRNA maturation factor
MSIEIANESGITVDTDAVLDCARYALDEMGVNPLAELSVLLVDDVLAFPMEEGTIDPGPNDLSGGEPTLLGDVVLCPEVAEKQALTVGHSTADELHLLTVHGVLHLLGYDHAEPDDEREMFSLQAKLLDGWHAARRG